MTNRYNRLKVRRAELNLKQKTVAAKADISPQYLFLLEHGKAKNPSIEVMKRLADVLQSTPQELFF